MRQLNRITTDPAVMGGKPCICGQRVTAGMLIGLVASGKDTLQILTLHPYLEAEDIATKGGSIALIFEQPCHVSHALN